MGLSLQVRILNRCINKEGTKSKKTRSKESAAQSAEPASPMTLEKQALYLLRLFN